MELHLDLLAVIALLVEYVAAIGQIPSRSTPLPLPSFFPTPHNFTFTEGDLARLECAINNLSTKKVIWKKRSDPNPITIGKRTFVADKRFMVEHTPLHRNWNLLIRQVRLDDAGTYECQVSSKARHLRNNVHLTVLASKVPITFQPEIRISGEKYVEKGQVINLTCNATGEGHPPDDLDWFKNGDKLSTNYKEEISIQKRLSLTTRTIVSILEIRNADMQDAGVYICRTSDLQITSARINVLNAYTNNVKRHKDKSDKLKSMHSYSGATSSQSLLITDNSRQVYIVFFSSLYLLLSNIT